MHAGKALRFSRFAQYSPGNGMTQFATLQAIPKFSTSRESVVPN